VRDVSVLSETLVVLHEKGLFLDDFGWVVKWTDDHVCINVQWQNFQLFNEKLQYFVKNLVPTASAIISQNYMLSAVIFCTDNCCWAFNSDYFPWIIFHEGSRQ